MNMESYSHRARSDDNGNEIKTLYKSKTDPKSVVLKIKIVICVINAQIFTSL